MVMWYMDPADANVWYEFDWSGTDPEGNPWLPTGVTIASYVVTTDGQTTLVAAQLGTSSSSGLANGSVFAQLTSATGSQSVVSCRITTSEGVTYNTTKAISILTRVS